MRLPRQRPDFYFYPRSPCGERHVTMPAVSALVPFLSTLSLRRATCLRQCKSTPPRFLSTLSLRRATCLQGWRTCHSSISIHALLAESDRKRMDIALHFDISIHALLAESDADKISAETRYQDFYPRSPCGERPQICLAISIYSLFLSTLSLRRATGFRFLQKLFYKISIHALLAESDHQPQPSKRLHQDFYPRSPCGERPRKPTAIANTPKFLSTLSLRRATCAFVLAMHTPGFLSTLSLRRATTLTACKYACKPEFLSTLSLRRATRANRLAHAPPQISIHALLAESDISQLQ